MGLPDWCLPMATPYDPAEDPPSSVDPLGTLSTAERIADVLLPGMTARMWRPRLLTFTALAAAVAEHVVTKAGGDEELRLEARLGFERILVSALVRQNRNDAGNWQKAVRRLPGRALANRALEAGNEPLTRANFLKGQAVNGPFGVMGRLARSLEIVDDEGRLSRSGEELLLAFAEDEELPGLLDDGGSWTEGGNWLNSLARATTQHIVNGRWWGSAWEWWYDLAERLRPDRLGPRERTVLRRLLAEDTLRARCVEVLRNRDTVKTFRTARDVGYRGYQDRETFLHGILPQLRPETNPLDQTLVLAIELAEAYEHTACSMQAVFDGLRWSLTRHRGQARVEQLVGDPRFGGILGDITKALAAETSVLRTLVKRVEEEPRIAELIPIRPLNELAEDIEPASQGVLAMIDGLMARHQRVQKAKRKGAWIDVGDSWTLLPGFGMADSEPPNYEEMFLHPFRIPNAYSFLGELGWVRMEVPDGEA